MNLGTDSSYNLLTLPCSKFFLYYSNAVVLNKINSVQVILELLYMYMLLYIFELHVA